MHLYRVPDVQPAEITEADPPESRRAQRPRQGPIGRGPDGIDDVGNGLGGGGVRRGVAIRQQPHVLGSLAQQKIDRREHDQHHQPHRGTGRAPAALLDRILHPGQQRHRADADTGKGDADREPPPTDEPVRQEQRLPGIAKTDAAGPDHHANGEIEVPGLSRQRREQQPAPHQHDTGQHHRARTGAVHQAADQRADNRRRHKAKGECAGGDTALPAEFGEDRREEQREGGTRVDADRHGDEGDGDNHPAVEKWKLLALHGRRVQCSVLTAPLGASPLMIEATWRTVSSA